MCYRIAIQILFVIVTVRITRTIEDNDENNIENTPEIIINTNDYINQGLNFTMKGVDVDDLTDNSVDKALQNVSSVNITTKSEPDVQYPSTTESKSKNEEIIRKDKTFVKNNLESNDLKENAKNKSKEQNCTSRSKDNNGNCKENEGTLNAKHEPKKSGRKFGEKWNPPRSTIGPENKPTDETIDLNKINIGPPETDGLTCESVGKTGRFNPYSMLNEKLFAYYMWGEGDPEKTIEFTVPSTLVFNHIRKQIDKSLKTPVDWSKRNIVLIDHYKNSSGVLVEYNDKGKFNFYPYTRGKPPLDHHWFIQFKQSADGKQLLMVMCEKIFKAYMFTSYKNIPSKKKMTDALASVGVTGRFGKSYLYQGHRWMPMEEMDEMEYWISQYGSKKPEGILPEGMVLDETEQDFNNDVDDDISTFSPFNLDF